MWSITSAKQQFDFQSGWFWAVWYQKQCAPVLTHGWYSTIKQKTLEVMFIFTKKWKCYVLKIKKTNENLNCNKHISTVNICQAFGWNTKIISFIHPRCQESFKSTFMTSESLYKKHHCREFGLFLTTASAKGSLYNIYSNYICLVFGCCS